MEISNKYEFLILISITSLFLLINGIEDVAAVNTSNIYVSTHGNDNWNGLSPIYNSTTGYGPKKTIKKAVSFASTNATLHIASGTYKEYKIIISKNLNIIGEDEDNTIINGISSGRMFKITSGAKVTISNLTLTKGINNMYDGCGGGAILNNGILTLNNCKITNNVATYAGGALFNWGTLQINNCIIQGNKVTKGHGGAILNEGTLSVIDSVLRYNQAYNGGSIYNDGQLTIINNIIYKNTATKWGGGALCNYGRATVTYSKLIYNTASYGGAIYNYNFLSIIFSQIIGNTATSGSAIKSSSGIVYAKSNWWGSNSNSSKLISGNIVITPWLSSPLGSVPIITGSNPADGAVNVSIDKVILIYFNKIIKKGNNVIYLKNSSGTIIPITTTINGSVLTINHPSLLKSIKYTVILHTGCITDQYDSPLQLTSISFSTGPLPVATSYKVTQQ